MMTDILNLVAQTPALLWIPTAVFAIQVLLSFWLSRINIWEEKGAWRSSFGDGLDQRDAAFLFSAVMWLIFFIGGFFWAMPGRDPFTGLHIPNSAHWAEFGVMWAFVGAFLGSSAVIIYTKRLLVWLCTKIWEGTVLTGETLISSVQTVQHKTADWKRNRQAQRSVSSKMARTSAALYLDELMDAIPVEFAEARGLAKRMATEAVDVLLDQRRRLLHDIEVMLNNTKRHKRAAPRSPEEKARQQLLDGIAKSRERLIAVETRLHELLLFLDSEAEICIRLAVQQGDGEEKIVEILRDYAEKRRIVFAEPSPVDPALRMATEEIERLSAQVAGDPSAFEADARRRTAAAAHASRTTS